MPRRAVLLPVVLACALLSGCFSQPVAVVGDPARARPHDPDSGALTQGQVNHALLVEENLGVGFEEDTDPSDEDDDENLDFGCLDGIDDLDREAATEAAEETITFVARNDFALPMVISGVATYDAVHGPTCDGDVLHGRETRPRRLPHSRARRCDRPAGAVDGGHELPVPEPLLDDYEVTDIEELLSRATA